MRRFFLHGRQGLLARSIGLARARRIAACSCPAITPQDARAHVEHEAGHLVLGVTRDLDGTARIVTVRARGGRHRGPPTWTGRAAPEASVGDAPDADD